jgi:hypothetical protein
MSNLEFETKTISDKYLGVLTQEKFDKKMSDVHYLLGGVIAILAVSVVTMMLMVCGFLIDSYRFNTTVYERYVHDEETNQLLLQSNKELLEKFNISHSATTSSTTLKI